MHVRSFESIGHNASVATQSHHTSTFYLAFDYAADDDDGDGYVDICALVDGILQVLCESALIIVDKPSAVWMGMEGGCCFLILYMKMDATAEIQ